MLEVIWTLLDHEDGSQRLEIIWQEHGVAMDMGDGKARGTGQGRELIERALPYQLDAETSYELGTNGVRCSIIIPVSRTIS